MRYIAFISYNIAIYLSIPIYDISHWKLQKIAILPLKASAKKLKERHIVGAPDLAVEVVSPSSQTHDRHRKLAAYARAGVPEYWIVDPDSHTVEVLILENGEYHSQGVYRGKATLPSQVVSGLLVHVEQFFVSVWEKTDL